MGVLRIRALPFAIYIKASNFWNLPHPVRETLSLLAQIVWLWEPCPAHPVSSTTLVWPVGIPDAE